MTLSKPLLDRWHHCPRVGHRTLERTEHGITLGKSVLARFADNRLTLDPARIVTLLWVAYGIEVPVTIVDAMRQAERCFKRNDLAMAQMHLALTGLPAVDVEMAQRLFVADWAMENGVTAQQLHKFAGLRKDDDDEEDDEDSGDEEGSGTGEESEDGEGSGDEDDEAESSFDSEHPRWPAGSPGGIGGEFAPKDAGDATGTLHDALAADTQSSDTTLQIDPITPLASTSTETSIVPAGLNAVALGPTTTGKDGSLNSYIQWRLSSPSQQGGLIVQEIKGNASETLEDGSVVNQAPHFWEVWTVNPGKDVTTLTDEGVAYDDHIGGKSTGYRFNGHYHNRCVCPIL